MALNYVTRELSNLACYDYFTPDTQRVIVQTQTFLDQELQILMCRPTELSSLIITIVWESSEVHWQKQFQVFLNKLTAKFNKILIIFDSFYISLLSNEYKTGNKRLVHSFIIGLISNLRAMLGKPNYSSNLYLFEHA
jgi:hypothetical protein